MWKAIFAPRYLGAAAEVVNQLFFYYDTICLLEVIVNLREKIQNFIILHQENAAHAQLC